MDIADIVVSLVSGATGAAAFSWIVRTWLTERLKQSISYEYSQKLESHKTELNSKLQVIQHENQVNQIRTSLFFDYEQDIGGIIGLVGKVNDAWIDDSYEERCGPCAAVPHISYKEIKSYYEKKKKSAFLLDEECTLAIELLLAYYEDSFPFEDGEGNLHSRNQPQLIVMWRT